MSRRKRRFVPPADRDELIEYFDRDETLRIIDVLAEFERNRHNSALTLILKRICPDFGVVKAYYALMVMTGFLHQTRADEAFMEFAKREARAVMIVRLKGEREAELQIYFNNTIPQKTPLNLN